MYDWIYFRVTGKTVVGITFSYLTVKKMKAKNCQM